MFLFDSTFNSLDVLAMLLLTVLGIAAATLAFPVKRDDVPEQPADDFDAINFSWPEARDDLR